MGRTKRTAPAALETAPQAPPGVQLGRRPPTKQKGTPTGPRTHNGELLDVRHLAERWGVTQHEIRARVARGQLPYRKWSGRVIFLKAEVDAYLAALPGVTLEQALANMAARRA